MKYNSNIYQPRSSDIVSGLFWGINQHHNLKLLNLSMSHSNSGVTTIQAEEATASAQMVVICIKQELRTRLLLAGYYTAV